MKEHAWLGWLFAAFCCLYLLTSGGHFYLSDDLQKLRALDAYVRTGSFSFPDGWAVGRDGRHYAWHALGSSLLMVPGYFAGRLVEFLVPFMPGDFVERFAIALQNVVFTAALATLVAAYARWLGRGVRASVFAAACFGLGTMAWPYAKGAASEPGATLALFAAVFALHVAVRQALAPRAVALAGVLVAIATCVRLELMAVVPGTLVLLGWQARARPAALARALVLLSVPLAGTVALAMSYNVLRYGTITNDQNFQMVQAAVQLPAGGRPVWALANMWHYTLNPCDGLLWFAPAVLLGLVGLPAFWRAHREAAAMLACALVPLFLFFTCVWGLSDWAWGTRYAYVFMPFACLPAAVLWDERPRGRPLWLGLATLGVAVQLLALPHNFNYLYERFRAAHHDPSIQTIMATPADSPLLLAAAATPPTLAGGLALLAAPRPSRAPNMVEYRQRAQFVPDAWPFLMLLTPLPRWAIGGVVAVLLMGLALALAGLRRTIAAGQPPARSADPPGDMRQASR